MSSYQPRLSFLLPDKIAHFKVIVQKVCSENGLNAGAKILGVSKTVVSGLLDEGKLTDKQARKILENYKKHKEKS